MYPHHPFKTKRPRPWPGEEVPAPSLTSPISLVDLQYDSLPLSFQQQLNDIAVSYGFSSGSQIHSNLQQERSRKRRRVAYPSISSDHSTSSPALDPIEKFQPFVPNYRSQNQSGQSAAWLDVGMSPMQSPSSPLARRMAGLGQILCPCCGFNGLRQQDGYQPLPEAPPMDYGCDRPYTTEKPLSMPPSMTLQNPESYGVPGLGLGSQDAFNCDPTYIDLPLLPDQSALPYPPPAEDGSSPKNSSPDAGFYTSMALKQENDLSNLPTMNDDQMLPPDQASVSFHPGFLGLSVPGPLPQQTLPCTESLPPYSLPPTADMGNVVVPECWTETSLIEPQTNFDVLLPHQRGGKRGPFKDPGLREQTAQTRKIGSCIRCRMQRIRCEHNPDEPGGPCITCKRVANSRAGRFPCLRYKITDVRLYKPGQVPGFEWTRRWSNNISDPIQGWASGEIKIIKISEGLSTKPIEFRVRRFVPQEGDKLERTWDFEGQKRSVIIPPYALVDLEEGKKAYGNYIRDSMSDAFKKLLGRSDSLLYRTYLQAWNMYRDPSTPMESLEILSRTLKLWMSIRLSTRSGFIVGNETLGMPPNILDETSPNHGSIPVPPVLGAQLDLILIHHIQTKLRRELLDRLQKVIAKNKQNTWLVTYLVIFILLHNTALITAHDASYARKHGMKRRFAREDKVKEYHLGANILLAHFHYCNKGIYPFSDECKDQDLRSLANLDDEKIQFVHATRAYVKRQSRDWEDLQGQAAYEDDYFFVSQLFEANWQPGNTV